MNFETMNAKLLARWTRIRAFLEPRRSLFTAQGSVVATWRTYQGRRLGPYYHLVYREKGRQSALYLGRALELVEQVREVLADWQQKLRMRQIINRLSTAARKALRESKEVVRQHLAAVGIHMKGWEMRGIRAAYNRDFQPLRRFVPPTPAPTFVPPVPPSLWKWFWGHVPAAVFGDGRPGTTSLP